MDFYFKEVKQKNLKENKEKLKEVFKKTKQEGKKIFKTAVNRKLYKEIKQIFKNKNLSYWSKLKTSVELLEKKIEEQKTNTE